MTGPDSDLLGKMTALRQLADELDRNAETVSSLAYDTAQMTASIRDQAYWSGQAADGYSQFCDSVTGGLHNMPGPLHGIAQAVRGYAAQAEASALLGDSTTDGSGATDDVNQNLEALKELWEATEPIRKVLETIMVPTDLAGIDGALYTILRTVKAPAEILESVDELYEMAELAKETPEAFSTLIAAAKLAEENGPAIALWAFQRAKWLKYMADWAPQLEWVSRGLGIAGLIGDFGTIISPLDRGVMGELDRAMGLLNGGLLATDLAGSFGWVAAANAFDEVPFLGEGIIAGTSVYLAGDFLYHHWTGFRDVCNDAGHLAVNVMADTVTTVESWF